MPHRIIRDPVATAFEELHGDHEAFDAVLSDPPYGLGFMGKGWDHGVPSTDVWAAMLPLLRPGANVALFGGTRTAHRLAVAVEDAGFEIRDSIIAWMYGSGWPKPANVSKYIDRKLGAERPVVGSRPWSGKDPKGGSSTSAFAEDGQRKAGVTAAGSPEAARFDGYHANLKPAHEPCILARVPPDGGMANNAMVHGVAGLNIDGCRMATTDDTYRNNPEHDGRGSNVAYDTKTPKRSMPTGSHPQGRWPANVILTCEELLCGPGDPSEIQHDPRCMVAVLDGQSGTLTSGTTKAVPRNQQKQSGWYRESQQGKLYTARTGDTGGASRFFYTAKVSRAERGVSAHPCMKPLALCTYIARLLLPPPRADGKPRRILVPYSGSGSEMIGCLASGWDEVVGVEWDEDCDNPGKRPDYWADVAEYRIAEHMGQLSEEHLVSDVAGDRATQLGLFG